MTRVEDKKKEVSSPANTHGSDDRDPSKEEDIMSDGVMVGKIEPQRNGHQQYGHQSYGHRHMDHFIWEEGEGE